MRRILIITLLLAAVFIAGCQDTKTSDSEIKLIDYKQTDCQGHGAKDRPNIVSREIQDNVLTLEIKTRASCCIKTKGSIQIIDKFLDKNTISLSYENTTDEICNCICDYKLTYTIEGISNFEDYNYKMKGAMLK